MLRAIPSVLFSSMDETVMVMEGESSPSVPSFCIVGDFLRTWRVAL